FLYSALILVDESERQVGIGKRWICFQRCLALLLSLLENAILVSQDGGGGRLQPVDQHRRLAASGHRVMEIEGKYLVELLLGTIEVELFSQRHAKPEQDRHVLGVALGRLAV